MTFQPLYLYSLNDDLNLSAPPSKQDLQRNSQILVLNSRRNILRISTRTTGSSICLTKPLTSAERSILEKDRNLLRLHQRSRPKISSVRLRLPSSVYRKILKTPYEPLLLQFFTEQVYHLTAISPKMKRKQSKT